MKSHIIERLSLQLNEYKVDYQALKDKIASVQHDAGEQAKLLSRLNGQLARLETSNDADQVVASQLDDLLQTMNQQKARYDEILAQEKQLIAEEMDAALRLQTLQNQLALEQLKSGNTGQADS